jgi:hypothetical protein
MKWLSRKLFVMLLTNAVFTGMFIFTLQLSPSSIAIIGNTLIVMIGFFNAVYCGANVMDKFLRVKGAGGDDGK